MSESEKRPESEAAALAAAIRGGDEPAFDRLVAGHRRELLVHCYRMLGSLDDAEDAVQESMLRAWRYRESLKEGASPRPWLYRIATRVCRDAIARDERLIAHDLASELTCLTCSEPRPASPRRRASCPRAPCTLLRC